MSNQPSPERLVPSAALPCPECIYSGCKGDMRIGNRRGHCGTCNRFVQSVIRLTQRRLKERYAAEFAVLRAQVEKDLYPQVVASWSEAHPMPADHVAKELGL